MMQQAVLNRVLALTGTLDETRQARLELLCAATVAVLEMQLRDDLTPEDCRESFLTAACLRTLAAMEDNGDVSEFKAGDLTVKTTRQGSQAEKLREQAMALMGPYLKDRFVFAGV